MSEPDGSSPQLPRCHSQFLELSNSDSTSHNSCFPTASGQPLDIALDNCPKSSSFPAHLKQASPSLLRRNSLFPDQLLVVGEESRFQCSTTSKSVPPDEASRGSHVPLRSQNPRARIGTPRLGSNRKKALKYLLFFFSFFET